MKKAENLLSEIFNEGINLYLKNFLPVFIILLIGMGQYFMLLQFGGDLWYKGNLYLYTTLLSVIIAIISNIYVYVILDKSYSNKINNFFEVFKIGISKFFRGTAALLIYISIVILGTFLFVVPGVYFAVKYFFVIPAAVLEDKDISPFKLSAIITKNNFWITFLMLLLLYVLPAAPWFDVSNLPYKNLLVYIGLSFIAAIFWPYLLAVQVVLFKKLKKKQNKNITKDTVVGIKTFPGCLISISLMTLVIILVSAYFITMRYTKVGEIVSNIMYGKIIKYPEGITLDIPKGWALEPYEGKDRLLIMPRLGLKNVSIIVICKNKITELGFEPSKLDINSKDLAEALKLSELKFLNSPSANTKAKEFHKNYEYCNLTVSDINGQKWATAIYKKEENSKKWEWRFDYTIIGDCVVQTNLIFPEGTDEIFPAPDEELVAIQQLKESIKLNIK